MTRASRSASPHRALVTGAAGFIGSHLVRSLLDRGSDVIGVDNERSGDWGRVDPRCEQVHSDMSNMGVEDFARVAEGADVCFHLAAEKYNSSSSSPQRVVDVNISATQRLLEALSQAQVPKVVFTSSLYAYGSLGPDPMRESDVPAPITTYGMSKVAGEHLLRISERDHGLRWSVARLFFVYGPRQYAEGGYKSVIVSNFERIRAGERPTIYGDGKQQLDYVFIDDVVAALLMLTRPDHDGALYNIGTGNGTTINDLTDLMRQVADCSLDPAECPPDWTADTCRVADMTLTSSELGWAPTVDLREGLHRVWTWMVANG